jgi:hypothetical protein
MLLQELSHVKNILILNSFMMYVIILMPFLMSFVTFVAYVLAGEELTAGRVFTTVYLYSLLQVRGEQMMALSQLCVNRSASRLLWPRCFSPTSHRLTPP